MDSLPSLEVKPLFAFYLGPWPNAASGGEAIIYAPAYNDHMRNRMIRKGFRLLSNCGGSFSEGGEEALYILPPTDDSIRSMIRILRSRLPAEEARLSEDIEELQELLKDTFMDADERQQYRARLRALLSRQKGAGTGIPTFKEAKTYFMREYHARIALQVPEQYRNTIRLIAQENEIAQAVRDAWASEDVEDADNVNEEAVTEPSGRKRRAAQLPG